MEFKEEKKDKYTHRDHVSDHSLSFVDSIEDLIENIEESQDNQSRFQLHGYHLKKNFHKDIIHEIFTNTSIMIIRSRVFGEIKYSLFYPQQVSEKIKPMYGRYPGVKIKGDGFLISFKSDYEPELFKSLIITFMDDEEHLHLTFNYRDGGALNSPGDVFLLSTKEFQMPRYVTPINIYDNIVYSTKNGRFETIQTIGNAKSILTEMQRRLFWYYIQHHTHRDHKERIFDAMSLKFSFYDKNDYDLNEKEHVEVIEKN